MSNVFATTQEVFRWKIRKHKKQVVNFCNHFMMCGALGLGLMVATSGGALANPQGGSVVAGSATITNTATELQINQSSDRALIEWSSFNVGAGETTRFIQPSSSAIAINRVINSNQISSINGNLIANGKVVIINPNGVLIGANGNIDTNSFLATSADIDNDAFMNGTGALDFNRAGNIDAVVENRGTISVAAEGLAALVAPTVRNNGVIQGNLAKVQLAAADTFAVDFYGDGLIQYAVQSSDQKRTVTSENKGEIFADGGAVLMTAADASDVVDSVINNEGVIQAASLERRGGKIVLTGAGAKVKVSGKIDASGKGDADGGEINIGGDFQGQGDLARAATVDVTETAELYADAGDNGNGGDVIIWSDVKTTSRGKYYARGGTQSGNGGLVETSAKDLLDVDGSYVNTLATNGQAGDWLLDPDNILISTSGVSYVGPLPATGTSTIDVATINAALSNVILQANDGITVGADVNIAAAGVGLSLIAGVAGADIPDVNGLNALAAGTGTINFTNQFIRTNGGDVSFHSGNSITQNNATIFTDGGDITMISGDIGINNNAALGAYGGDVLLRAIAAGSGANRTSGNVSTNSSSIDTTDPTAAGIGGITLTENGSALPQGSYGNPQNVFVETENGGSITIEGERIGGNSICFAAGGPGCSVADPIATDVVVTIDSFTKIYGVLDPLFTWGITSGSLTGGDTLSVDLARTLQNTLAGEQVGNYSIFETNNVLTGSGLYNITFINGNLQIIPASVVIKAIDQTKTYGDTFVFDETNPGDYTVTGIVTSVNGFATGDGVTNVDLASAGAAATAGVAGSPYTITASNATGTGLTSGNYNITYQTGDLTVNPAALLVTANNDAKIYDGLAYSGGNGVTFSGFVNSETAGSSDLTGAVVYGGSSQSAVNAGNYVISASGLNSNNYTLSYADGALSVAKALLTVTTDDKSITYGGLAPALTNTITGFVNGETAGVIDTTGTLSSGTLFTADAGTYTDTLNSSGYLDNNYAFQYVAGDLTINKAGLTVTALNDSKVYDGLGYTGGNGVNIVGFVNGDNVVDLGGALGYSGTSQGATNVVGSPYVITAGGYSSGNYNITYNDGQLTITPAALTITANNDAKVYDALAYSGGNGVTYSGFVNGENENTSDLTGTIGYSGTSQGAVNVGNYVIAASGQNSDNYAITYNDGQLDITAAALLLVAADNQTKTYGDSFTFIGNEFGTTGLLGTDSVTGATITSGGASNLANAGSYSIDISNAVGTGLGNYNISYAPGTFTVNKALLTVTADDKSMIYGGLAPTLTDTITGFVNGETAGVIDTTGSVASGTLFTADSGFYADTLNASGYADNNYAFTYVAGDLTIGRSGLTGFTNSDGKTYDGLAYTGGNGVNYVGFRNGDDASVLMGTLSYSGPSQGAIDVGTYLHVGGGQTAQNYNVFYFPGLVNITPAALTVTADNQVKTYGGTFNFTGSEFTTSGLVNGETLTSASLSSLGAVNTASVAGSDYDIDISAATGGTANLANYSVTYNKGALTVNPAALTITADNQVKTYGDTFTFAGTEFGTSGLVNGETLTNATLSSLGAVNTASVAGSDYDIDISNATGGTANLGNYNVSYAKGAMTVNPAALTVTANNDSKIYDASPYSGGNGVIYVGFVNGETDAVLGGTLAYGGSSQGAVNVNGSPYVISASGLTSGNYTISYVDGSLTITPRRIVIDADNKTKTYGDADPALTYRVLGSLVGGDTPDSILAGSLVRDPGENTGFYSINQGTVTTTTANYVAGYRGGSLQITPADLLVTANDDSKIADGVPYSGGNGVSYSGFKFNDDPSVLFFGGPITYSGSSQGAADPGSYVIDPSARVKARNYRVTFAPGTLDITPAPLSFFEIDPLGRPIISVANQAIVLDAPFEEIETLEILTDVGIADSGDSATALAGIEPAAGGEAQTAEQVAGIEPAAGGDDNEDAQEGDEFSSDIQCANDFLDDNPCDIEDI